MKFICPECGSNRLEELMTNVVVTSEITSIDEDGDHEYGNSINEGGEVENYQCVECGYIIPVDCCDELADWVEENC